MSITPYVSVAATITNTTVSSILYGVIQTQLAAVTATYHAEFEAIDMDSSNDEFGRRAVAPAPNEAALSKSSFFSSLSVRTAMLLSAPLRKTQRP